MDADDRSGWLADKQVVLGQLGSPERPVGPDQPQWIPNFMCPAGEALRV
jgi:hypothetical protein